MRVKWYYLWEVGPGGQVPRLPLDLGFQGHPQHHPLLTSRLLPSSACLPPGPASLSLALDRLLKQSWALEGKGKCCNYKFMFP